MNNPPIPEPNPDSTLPDPDNQNIVEPIYEQHLNLKLEVEQLYRKVDRLRGWLQTLLSGFLVATIIALGITIWFAYRLLLQEKIAQQETKKMTETQTEILEKNDRMETELQSYERQIEDLNEDIAEKLSDRSQELQEIRQELEKITAEKTEEER